MCSRFQMTAPPRDLMRRFGLTVPPLPYGPLVRPTDRALIIDGTGQARLLRWGLPVDWDSRPLINARAETLARRPTFRRLLASRVLVPATAYFEWRKEGKARHKNLIEAADHGLFAFAGLAEGDFFTIITCPPAPEIAFIHDRMPAILPRAGEAAWTDPTLPFAEVAALLKPLPGGVTATEENTSGSQPDLFAR